MDKIVVFGIGYIGKWFINEIGENYVECIIDNNDLLCGTCWRNIPIVSLKDYLDKKINANIIISSKKYYFEMANQLEENGIFDYSLYAEYWIEHFLDISNQSSVYLINTHTFSNIGDYAITYAETLFLKNKCYVNQPVLIPSCICRDGLHLLKKIIRERDTILISGGGYLGNLWMECGESNVRAIVSEFPNNKIIILPQSIYYSDNKYGFIEKENSHKIYAQANNLTVCIREKVSMVLASEIFAGRIIKCPDMVLSLFCNEIDVYSDRNKIFTCFREDAEGYLSSECKEKIISILREYQYEIEKISMDLQEDVFVSSDNAESIVVEMMNLLRRAKLVVTDRLHCMLLCVITKTPCIFWDNLTKKLSGTYKYIKDFNYIRCGNIEDSKALINEMIGAEFELWGNNAIQFEFAELVNLINGE